MDSRPYPGSHLGKAVARFLAAARNSFYLPLTQWVSFIGGRKNPVRIGYIVLFGELENGYTFTAAADKR